MNAAGVNLVGVVVVNYNYGRFLGEALTSVFTQTRPPASVVLVDDGSTDGSLQVAAAYPGISRIVQQENLGHVAAFQAGFAAISTDIVMFLDADDFLYSHCMESLVARWSSGSISKIQFQLDTVDALSRNQNMTFPHLTRELTPAEVRRRAFRHGIYPWTVSSGNAYSRAYLDSVLPIDSRRFPKSPDGYVNKLAPLYGDVVSIPEALGAYRVHGANLWAQSKSLNASVINKTVALDLSLDEEFRTRGRQLNAGIEPRDELLTPQHLEYRLLGFILDARGAPVRADSRLSLWRKALRAVWRQERLTAKAKLIWITWFTVLTCLPRKTAEDAYVALRSQTGRAPLAKILVTLSRGVKRSKTGV